MQLSVDVDAPGPNRDDYRFTEVVMKHVKEHQIYSRGLEGLPLHSYTGLDKWPPSHPTEPRSPALKAGAAHAARGETLTAPGFDSVNTFKRPQVVAPQSIAARKDAACGCLALDLAPASLTVVSLD